MINLENGLDSKTGKWVMLTLPGHGQDVIPSQGDEMMSVMELWQGDTTYWRAESKFKNLRCK